MKLKTNTLNTKEIVEEFTNALWNDKDLGIIDQLVHKDITIHGLQENYHGIHALKDIAKTWIKGFPNLQVNSEQTFAEKDLVCIQWRAEGTHQGEFKGRKPTRKDVTFNGSTIYRINNGKMVEYWGYCDMEHIYKQID